MNYKTTLQHDITAELPVTICTSWYLRYLHHMYNLKIYYITELHDDITNLTNNIMHYLQPVFLMYGISLLLHY